MAKREKRQLDVLRICETKALTDHLGVDHPLHAPDGFPLTREKVVHNMYYLDACIAEQLMDLGSGDDLELLDEARARLSYARDAFALALKAVQAEIRRTTRTHDARHKRSASCLVSRARRR